MDFRLRLRLKTELTGRADKRDLSNAKAGQSQRLALAARHVSPCVVLGRLD
jgi:hypothetical protein